MMRLQPHIEAADESGGNTTMGRLLTLDEVSERTRTPLATLRYWRHMGQGPPTFKLGRRVVAREEDVEAWIAEAVEAARD
jgi:predicted DNA-binding transcriptional regulator AlpA